MIYQIDETRNKILEAAEETFVKNGLYETKMKDLALSIGISRTSLYRYYRDKLDLSLAIVRRLMDVINDDERIEAASPRFSLSPSVYLSPSRHRHLSQPSLPTFPSLPPSAPHLFLISAFPSSIICSVSSVFSFSHNPFSPIYFIFLWFPFPFFPPAFIFLTFPLSLFFVLCFFTVVVSSVSYF